MTEVAAHFAPVETPYALALRFVDVPLAVRTNDREIWARLRTYFSPFVAESVPDDTDQITLIQGEAAPAGIFVDVRRGNGRRPKEAVRDLAGGRLILKRATGVLMGLEPRRAFAIGDLIANLNQAVNLVNACYAKTFLRRGHVLFHASGVTWGGRTAILSGVPGAGKSTTALHLVEEGFHFLSNDRVLAQAAGGRVGVVGYPKQPRVNPGTLLHHPRLVALVKPEDRETLSALPQEELWSFERKSDVDLDTMYGPGTVQLTGTMKCLILLKWRLNSGTYSARRLSPSEGMANLPLFYKDLGAFDLDRPSMAPRTVQDLSRYAAILEQIDILEISGGVDFSALVDLVGEELAK